MALFKIEKGLSTNLATARPTTHEGWCYFTTNDGKFYIDIADGDDLTSRVVLNAGSADKLTTSAGSATNPVYFMNGVPMACNYELNKTVPSDALFTDTDTKVTQTVTTANATFPLLLAPNGQATTTTTGAYFDSGVTLNPSTNTIAANISGSSASCTGNAATATALTTSSAGNENTPVYFKNGKPVACTGLDLDINGASTSCTGNSATATALTTSAGDENTPVYFKDGKPVACTSVSGDYLPLSAGENHKLTGPLGLTAEVMYGTTLPTEGFDGQLFFLEDTSPALPTGGSAGQALIKNSSTDGDASWQDIVALPEGGTANQIIVKNSAAEGDAKWADGYATASVPGLVSTGTQTFGGTKTFSRIVVTATADAAAGADNSPAVIVGPASGAHIEIDQNEIMAKSGTSGTAALYLNGDGGNVYLGGSAVYTNGTVLYGAAWNDYAEYRAQKEEIEPGYCVASADNGQVYKTTEKFQACDGIVSDTYGFVIGETDECKTPLAVAGRVLAYCEGNRYNYHAGDTVCAGPNGKVMKMTREEIREWPDRIIGIVSEIPEYENWGTGNVPVNGRIWIKIK